jgi:hypothetical protein
MSTYFTYGVNSVAQFNSRVPGLQDGPVFADKQICVHADYSIRDRFPITIAPNTGDIDRGTLLGVTTADSLYRPVRRYPIQTAAASGVQVITVPGGAAINVGDNVAVMKADGTGLEVGGAVTSVVVNGSNLDIHFTTATAEALAVNDYLFVQDGSETALVILGDPVADAAQNKVANAFVSGKFYLSQLIGADAIAQKDLGARVIPFGLDPATGANESILIV